MDEILKMFNLCKDTLEEKQYETFSLFSDKKILLKLINLGFEEVLSFGNACRWIYVNKHLRSVYTYCEGDISLQVFNTDEAYNKNYSCMKEFYSNY